MLVYGVCFNFDVTALRNIALTDHYMMAQECKQVIPNLGHFTTLWKKIITGRVGANNDANYRQSVVKHVALLRRLADPVMRELGTYHCLATGGIWFRR